MLYSDVCLICTPNFVLTTHIYFLIKVSTYDLQSYSILSLRDTSTSRFNALKKIDHLCNRNGFCMQRHLPDAVFISCLLLLGVDGSRRFRIHPRICTSYYRNQDLREGRISITNSRWLPYFLT